MANMLLKIAALVIFAALAHCKDAETLEEAVQRLELLEKRLAEAKRRILEQDDVIKTLGRKNKVHDDAITYLTSKQKDQRNQLQEQQTAIQSLKDDAKANSPIAFTAYAGSTVEYVEGDSVAFSSIVTNLGANYNAGTSTFNVANNGIYMFTVSIYTAESDAVSVDIMQNQDVLVRVFAGDTIQQDQATNIVIAECFVGDQITVRVGDNDGYIEGDASNALTTFSGFLIIRT